VGCVPKKYWKLRDVIKSKFTHAVSTFWHMCFHFQIGKFLIQMQHIALGFTLVWKMNLGLAQLDLNTHAFSAWLNGVWQLNFKGQTLTLEAKACFDLPVSTLSTIVPLSGLGPLDFLAQTMQTSSGSSRRLRTTSSWKRPFKLLPLTWNK